MGEPNKIVEFRKNANNKGERSRPQHGSKADAEQLRRDPLGLAEGTWTWKLQGHWGCLEDLGGKQEH